MSFGRRQARGAQRKGRKEQKKWKARPSCLVVVRVKVEVPHGWVALSRFGGTVCAQSRLFAGYLQAAAGGRRCCAGLDLAGTQLCRIRAFPTTNLKLFRQAGTKVTMQPFQKYHTPFHTRFLSTCPVHHTTPHGILRSHKGSHFARLCAPICQDPRHVSAWDESPNWRLKSLKSFEI